jgi:hypothetical protein
MRYGHMASVVGDKDDLLPKDTETKASNGVLSFAKSIEHDAK